MSFKYSDDEDEAVLAEIHNPKIGILESPSQAKIKVVNSL